MHLYNIENFYSSFLFIVSAKKKLVVIIDSEIFWTFKFNYFYKLAFCWSKLKKFLAASASIYFWFLQNHDIFWANSLKS